jgi:hypothetical protein
MDSSDIWRDNRFVGATSFRVHNAANGEGHLESSSQHWACHLLTSGISHELTYILSVSRKTTNCTGRRYRISERGEVFSR